MNKFNRCISLTFMLTSILPCGMMVNKKLVELKNDVNYYSSAIVKNSNTKEKKNISKFEIEEQKSVSPYYVIFDGDESTSFSNALSLTFNTSVSGLYNTRSDYDYFITSTLSSDIFAKFDINRGTNLLIYRKETSGNKLIMNYASVTTNNIIYLERGYQYYFRISQNNSYTGSYNFEVETINVTNYQNYYMKYNYSNGSLTTFEVLYRDYSSAPSSNVRQGYNPRGSFGITTNGNLSTNEYVFFGNNSYVSDENGVLSENIDDDERMRVKTYQNKEYPASTICYSSASSGNLTSQFTSFYVDNNYLMTAAHCIITSNNFFENIIIKPMYSNIPNPLLYFGEYYISEAYIPMKWYQDKRNNNDNHEYDWAILKVGETITEPTDTLGHGYLGIGYDNESTKVMNCMGYPICCSVESSQNTDIIIMSNAEDTFYINSNYNYRSIIDTTKGNSGGPIFEIVNESSAITYGIVSGWSDNTNNMIMNYFTRIDKHSFSLLEELA